MMRRYTIHFLLFVAAIVAGIGFSLGCLVCRSTQSAPDAKPVAQKKAEQPKGPSWYAAQVVFRKTVALRGIRVKHPDFADQEMTMVMDLKGDGQNTEPIGPSITAGIDGDVTVEPHIQYEVEANKPVFVRYYQDKKNFTKANDVIVDYIINHKRKVVNTKSENVQMQGPIMIIDP